MIKKTPLKEKKKAKVIPSRLDQAMELERTKKQEEHHSQDFNAG